MTIIRTQPNGRIIVTATNPIQDGTLLYHAGSTYKVGYCPKDGWYIFRRAGVICQGQHPDHGVAFVSVVTGQTVGLVDGRTATIEAAPNGNLRFDVNPFEDEGDYWDCPDPSTTPANGGFFHTGEDYS